MAVSHQVWGWERFFEEVETFLTTANGQIEFASPEYAHFVVERLGVCIQALSSLCHQMEGEVDSEIVEIYETLVEVRGCCRSLVVLWQAYIDQLDSNYSVVSRAEMESYQAPRLRQGRGRPQVIISQEQLQYLRSMNFSWTQISDLLGVSRMTLYRRRRDLGLLEFDEPRRNVSDNELHRLLQAMRQEMPSMGEALVIGQLHAMGYDVTRRRVRVAIHATDPLNTALRWRGILTTRRPYSVAGPNSLWHIDGHHKLVRWGMVTHGGIDGYSRLVVYLHCSNNNRAAAVYDLFLTAIRQYALPSRVRSDHGRENYLVAVHMLERRGPSRNSMITGSSVHNQRIERFWRDMHRCITSVYYRLFYYLEHQNHLDPDNKFHRYALHYIYLPRINRSLEVFREGWNHHGVRTEHNLSPHQLFVRGALQLQRRGLHALDFFERVDNMYGVEDDDSTVEENEYTVYIPPNSFALTEEHLEELQSIVSPLAESDNFGIELYIETLTFIRTLVSNNPNLYTAER